MGYTTNAPELTHLKSRTTIGAGVMTNTRENLTRWVQNPHSIKPGVHMPAIAQKPDDINALVDYLETLK
jgi:cytochrome c oxidase subunit 2